jgi:hypothetical protein
MSGAKLGAGQAASLKPLSSPRNGRVYFDKNRVTVFVKDAFSFAATRQKKNDSNFVFFPSRLCGSTFFCLQSSLYSDI